jgi:hypothetical protein
MKQEGETMTKIKAPGKGQQQQISKTISSTAAEKPPYHLLDELLDVSLKIGFMRSAIRSLMDYDGLNDDDILGAALMHDHIKEAIEEKTEQIGNFMKRVEMNAEETRK